MQLEEFNALDAGEADAVVRPCVDIDRWVAGVVERRPYASVEQLLEAAREAASPFTEDEVDAALAHHPRIGQRVEGGSAEASLSRSEQAGVGIDDSVTERLRAGNLAYEERFGRVFLIRAAGRDAEEILGELNRRLEHTEEEELPVIADQLRQIAVLRLEGIVTP